MVKKYVPTKILKFLPDSAWKELGVEVPSLLRPQLAATEEWILWIQDYWNYRTTLESRGFTEELGKFHEEIDRLWASMEDEGALRRIALRRILSQEELEEILEKTKIHESPYTARMHAFLDGGERVSGIELELDPKTDGYSWLCLAGYYVRQKKKDLFQVSAEKDKEQVRKAKLHNSIVDHLGGKNGLAATLEKAIINKPWLIGERGPAQRVFCTLRKVKKGKIKKTTVYFDKGDARAYYEGGGIVLERELRWAEEEGIFPPIDEDARIRGEVAARQWRVTRSPKGFGSNLLEKILGCFIDVYFEEMEDRTEDWELDTEELKKMAESRSWSPRIIEIDNTELPESVILKIAAKLRELEDSIKKGFKEINDRYKGEAYDAAGLREVKSNPYVELWRYVKRDIEEGGLYDCWFQKKAGYIFGLPKDREPSEDQKWEIE